MQLTDSARRNCDLRAGDISLRALTIHTEKLRRSSARSAHSSPRIQDAVVDLHVLSRTLSQLLNHACNISIVYLIKQDGVHEEMVRGGHFNESAYMHVQRFDEEIPL